ncbi:hypothetical protein MSAR_34530 [Mycolicibacterium sarraceniae]|uniref:Uncharacterized protein n=1 Tax=Mycolicibacterium sarraceniae TaxID=1534348 RepID=A0A7I7STJ5_9MYCO|nr:hypothetical protein MSAR_34530 [Mycolicibacterium sarraceniae]
MTRPELNAAIEAAHASARWRNPPGTTERSTANIDRWRAGHPNAVRTWTTKYGFVVAFLGVKVYYTRCKHCRRPFSVLRKMAYHGRTGRWPVTCDECRGKRARKHNAGAKDRMRRARGKPVRAVPRKPVEPPSHDDVVTERFYLLAEKMGMGPPLPK